MAFVPYIPPPPKQRIDAPKPANDDVRKRASHSCIICDEPASIGVGVYPAKGIAGDWYCAAHAPQADRPPHDYSVDEFPAEFSLAVTQDQAPASKNILRLENMATGVVSEIDLLASDKRSPRSKGASGKIDWAQHEEIEAQLNPDYLDEIFDVLKLQQYADGRNREAALSKSTDRYCRCGALAQTAYRVKGNAELWRCDECI